MSNTGRVTDANHAYLGWDLGYPLQQLSATWAHRGPRDFAGVVVVACSEGHAGPLLFVCDHRHGTVHAAQQCGAREILTRVNEV